MRIGRCCLRDTDASESRDDHDRYRREYLVHARTRLSGLSGLDDGIADEGDARLTKEAPVDGRTCLHGDARLSEQLTEDSHSRIDGHCTSDGPEDVLCERAACEDDVGMDIKCTGTDEDIHPVTVEGEGARGRSPNFNCCRPLVDARDQRLTAEVADK